VSLLKHEDVQGSLGGSYTEEEMKLRAILASSPDAITVSDLDGKITECNQAALDMGGFSSKDEIIGKNALKFIAKKDRERAMENLKKTLEQGSVRNIEYTFLAKDGREYPAELSASVVRDSLGNPTGFVAITKDITERKKAEEAVRESEQKYRSIVEMAPDGIITANKKGVVTSCNTAALRRTGFSKDEIVGKHWTKVGTVRARDIPRFLKLFGSMVRGKIPPPIEFVYRCKDGTTRWGEGHFGFLEVGGKKIGIQAILRDITKRKTMEERIAYLANIVDNAKVAIATVDMNRIVMYCNRATEEMLGWTSKEMIGKAMARFCPKASKQIEATMEEGFCSGKELEYMKKDGSSLLCSTSTFLMKDKEGNTIGIGGIAIDITERKKAEEELRFLKEFNEGIVHSIGDALLVIDPNDYTIITANETALKQLKLRREDLIGKTCYEATHHRSTPCKPPHHTCPIQEMLRTGKPVTVEHTHFDRDNKEFFVEVSARPVKNQEGKIVHFVHLARDITERKKAEEKIRESEERYRVLVESAADAIFTLNEAGDFLSANQEAARAMGKTPEDMIGKNMYNLFPKDVADLQMAGIKAVFQTGNPLLADETLTQTKFGRRWYSTTLMPIRDSNGKIIYVMGIARDTTERKKMEEQLKEYAEHLEEMVEKRTAELKETQQQLLKSERLAAIGELATMVGHDLRNPLQSIENAAYYLNNELSRSPPSIPIPQKTMEMLQVLNDSVNYADKIMRDLQDFSATPKPILEKTSINAIVEETLAQVKAPENVKLITKLGHIPEIKADKDMIKRAFLNLAINGIQAVDKGGTLTVSTKKTKKSVEVSFKDIGVGISKEEMDKIFTPFFTTKAKGMGMGLPICKKFVDAHGGSIEVKSKEGKGSTFTVKLPIQQENGGERQ